MSDGLPYRGSEGALARRSLGDSEGRTPGLEDEARAGDVGLVGVRCGALDSPGRPSLRCVLIDGRAAGLAAKRVEEGEHLIVEGLSACGDRQREERRAGHPAGAV